jgi:hypothetical protein
MTNETKITPSQAFDAIKVLWPDVVIIRAYSLFRDDIVTIHHRDKLLQLVLPIGRDIDWTGTDGVFERKAE